MIHRVRALLFGVVIAGLLAVPITAQSARNVSVSADNRPDYSLVRREIQSFETGVNNTILSAFSGSAFVLTQKTKGVYLQGYGVIFSFVVNIHRALVTPFGVVQSEAITPEQKRRRIDDVIQRVSKTLLESGESLHQIRKEEAITIVLYVEDRNFPDEQNQNKTVVLSILKKDLDEVIQKEDRWKEFKLRMKAVEY